MTANASRRGEPTSIAESPQSVRDAEDNPFQITRSCLTLLLPEDLGHQHIERLMRSLLPNLSENNRVASVIFDCTHLRLIDPTDLGELMGLVQTISLMGKGVGFCSISPGFAALLVDLDLASHHAIFGRDLDDAIARLTVGDQRNESSKAFTSW